MRTLKFVTLVALLAGCGGSAQKPAEQPKAEEKPAAETAKADKTDAPKPADTAAAADTSKPADATAKPADATASKDAAPAGDCTKDMFKKYGQDAFLKVNDSIIAKAIAAPVDKVGPTFKKLSKNKAEAAKVKKDLAALLVKVYGGPDAYKGKDMEATHKGMKITSDQYDWFVSNVVVAALKENGVSDDDIKNCFAPPVVDASFKASIVGK